MGTSWLKVCNRSGFSGNSDKLKTEKPLTFIMLGVCKGHCLYWLLSFSCPVPSGHVLLWLLVARWSCSRRNQELQHQRNTHSVTTLLTQEADIRCKQKCKLVESLCCCSLLFLFIYLQHQSKDPSGRLVIALVSSGCRLKVNCWCGKNNHACVVTPGLGFLSIHHSTP